MNIRSYPVEQDSTIEMPGPMQFLSISHAPRGIFTLTAVVRPEEPLQIVRVRAYRTNEEMIIDPGWSYVGCADSLYFFAKALAR